MIDYRDLLTIVEQGGYYKCTSCNEYHLKYNRFCTCGSEKQLEMRECGNFVDDFKEELIVALRRAE